MSSPKSLIDSIVRLSLGELADFSAAKYDGDFSMTLSRQRRKHEYVAEWIGIEPGRQEEIYREFFERVAGVLPDGGRFYPQTMVFGRNMIPAEKISSRAPRDSDAWALALLECQFPGSWLPRRSRQRELLDHHRLVCEKAGGGS